jgi:hypothetical protein
MCIGAAVAGIGIMDVLDRSRGGQKLLNNNNINNNNNDLEGCATTAPGVLVEGKCTSTAAAASVFF